MNKTDKLFCGLGLRKKTEFGCLGECLDDDLCEYIDFSIHSYELYGYTNSDYEDTEEDTETIGKCRILEIRVLGYTENDIKYLADTYDDNFINAVEVLLDNIDLEEEEYATLYYVDELEIKEEYRGKGYGKLLMNAIIRDLGYNIVGIMVLKAFPFIREGSQEEKNKYTDSHVDDLNRFYTELGFTRLEDTEFMYTNTFRSCKEL